MKVMADSASSYSRVAEWIQWFKDDGQSLEADRGSGRPLTTVTDGNVQFLAQAIEEDGWQTMHETPEEPGQPHGAILTILHSQLRLRKI